MKNSKYTWKTCRQSGIPQNDSWGSREWRRYEERQARRRTRKEAQEEAKAELTISIGEDLFWFAAGVFLLWHMAHGKWWAGALYLAFGIVRYVRNHPKEQQQS